MVFFTEYNCFLYTIPLFSLQNRTVFVKNYKGFLYKIQRFSLQNTQVNRKTSFGSSVSLSVGVAQTNSGSSVGVAQTNFGSSNGFLF